MYYEQHNNNGITYTSFILYMKLYDYIKILSIYFLLNINV